MFCAATVIIRSQILILSQLLRPFCCCSPTAPASVALETDDRSWMMCERVNRQEKVERRESQTAGNVCGRQEILCQRRRTDAHEFARCCRCATHVPACSENLCSTACVRMCVHVGPKNKNQGIGSREDSKSGSTERLRQKQDMIRVGVTTLRISVRQPHELRRQSLCTHMSVPRDFAYGFLLVLRHRRRLPLHSLSLDFAHAVTHITRASDSRRPRAVTILSPDLCSVVVHPQGMR